MRYRDKLTGKYVSRATWLRSRAHGGTRYATVPGKPIARPKVKSAKPRKAKVPVRETRKRPAPKRQRPAKRPEPRKPARKPAERRKPVKRAPSKKAPAKKKPPAKPAPPELPVLIRWRYQRRGTKAFTDVEAVWYRGRVVAARVGDGRRSYFYDDPLSLVKLQRLFNTMPSDAPRIPGKPGDWWVQ